LFIIVLYFGASDLFEWARHPVHGKEKWLSPLFLYSRNFVGIFLLVWCFSKVIKGSLAMDLAAIRRGLVSVGKEHPAHARWMNDMHSSLDISDVDTKTGIRKIYDSVSWFSPLCVMVYALVMSLVAFDLIMSVDAHWYSTMFGGF